MYTPARPNRREVTQPTQRVLAGWAGLKGQ